MATQHRFPSPPSGAMQAFAAAALLLAASIFTPALADTQVGAAAIVVNNVTGTLASTRQRASLRAGIDVFQNETISTGETSASQVLFQDQTSLSIGPMSDVVLDRFVFDPDPSKSQVAVSLAKGVLRFSTGLLPKPDYELTTPTATIGVRGTVLTVTVSDNKTTTVSVGEGSAFVSARGRTVIVDAGFSTLVRPGMPPTNPVGSPPPPGLTTQMLTLLEAAGARLPVGTDVSGRGSPADMPQLNGNMMLSPNIDPQKQSEIRGHKKPGDP